jgi:hypothetical protein
MPSRGEIGRSLVSASSRWRVVAGKGLESSAERVESTHANSRFLSTASRGIQEIGTSDL